MTDTPPDPAPETPPDPEPTPDPEPVRDPDQVLADNRRLGRENAATRKELKAAQALIEEMKQAQLTDAEKRSMEDRLAGADEERAKWLPVVRELTFAKAAQGRTSDPGLVGELLSKADIDFTDETAITEAIDALIEKHPSLAPGPTQPSRPAFEQGPRGNGAPPQGKSMNDQLLDMLGIQRSG